LTVPRALAFAGLYSDVGCVGSVMTISNNRTAPVPRPSPPSADDTTTCPRCGESHDLAKVKGCIKCLRCGFKFDCNGW
jgi:hypothetical protein